MNCNCKWTEVVLAALVLVFTIWPQGTWSYWVVVVSAALLLIHALKSHPEHCMPSRAKYGMASTAPRSVRAKMKKGATKKRRR